jgi:hypothetical protein
MLFEILHGGIENTYNSAPIPSPQFDFEPYNDIEIILCIEDTEIIEKLNTVNDIQKYIKSLVRADLQKKGPC